EAALLASDADETAEGRSIITMVQDKYNVRRQATPGDARFIPFSAVTRLSGVDIGQRKLRKGAVDSVMEFARQAGGETVPEPQAFRAAVDKIARSGGTPLGLVENDRILGVIHLKDVVKPDVYGRARAPRNARNGECLMRQPQQSSPMSGAPSRGMSDPDSTSGSRVATACGRRRAPHSPRRPNSAD